MKRNDMLKIIEGMIDSDYPEIRHCLGGDKTPMDLAKSVLGLVELFKMSPPAYVIKRDWPRCDDNMTGWEKE